MKRIVLIWMAAFLMGGMAMAQHARHSDKMPRRYIPGRML